MQNPTPTAEVEAELNEKKQFVLPCFYASLPGLLALLIFNTVLVCGCGRRLKEESGCVGSRSWCEASVQANVSTRTLVC